MSCLQMSCYYKVPSVNCFEPFWELEEEEMIRDILVRKDFWRTLELNQGLV